jgi:ATP-dependent Clp protease ATP-binding subunit ClpC
VLGEGRLTDALGQTVSFANAVVVMTSNLGAGGPGSVGFAKSGSGPGADGERRQRIKQHYLSAVESFFRPEFVGRVDHVVPFRTLGDDTAGRLVRRALEEAFSREGFARREITVDVGEAVVEHLVELGFDERYGARPLKQAVESEVTPLLADLLAGRSDLAGATLSLEMDDGELVVRAE